MYSTLYKLLALLCLFGPFFLGAQAPAKPKPPVPAAPATRDLQVYRNALALGDNLTAIQALHYHLLSPGVDAAYRDTLAALYTQTGQYQQAATLVEERARSAGYSELRESIRANCMKQLQQPTAAIEAFQTLFAQTKKPAYGLEKLELEYRLRRLVEALATADALLALIPADDQTKLQVAKLDGKSLQEIGFRAGVLNFRGLILTDLKEKEKALAAIGEALKLEPDFEQAKNNKTVAEALPDPNK